MSLEFSLYYMISFLPYDQHIIICSNIPFFKFSHVCVLDQTDKQLVGKKKCIHLCGTEQIGHVVRGNSIIILTKIYQFLVLSTYLNDPIKARANRLFALIWTGVRLPVIYLASLVIDNISQQCAQLPTFSHHSCWQRWSMRCCWMGLLEKPFKRSLLLLQSPPSVAGDAWPQDNEEATWVIEATY